MTNVHNQDKLKPSKSNRVQDKRRRFRSIIARDNSTCHICRKVINEGEYTLDHIITKGEGGPNTIVNQKLAHYGCNHARNNIPYALLQKIQADLDALYIDWGAEEIIPLLRAEDKAKGKIYSIVNEGKPQVGKFILTWDIEKGWIKPE